MNPPVTLDGDDRRCVQLLLELRRHIHTVPADTVIHLIATDPAAPLDLPAWCHLTGHTYLGPVPGSRRPTYPVQATATSTPTGLAQPLATEQRRRTRAAGWLIVGLKRDGSDRFQNSCRPLAGHRHLGPVGGFGYAYRIDVAADARPVGRTRPWATDRSASRAP
jgi:tRNA 2-thiouridine synthesizing protein A